jgi:amidase
LGDP